MLDRQRLRDMVVACLLATVLALLFGLDSFWVDRCLTVAAILLALFFSVRPSVLPRLHMKDVFDTHQHWNIVKEQFSKDENFNQALTYVYNLSAEDYLQFCRLTNSMRYQAGQLALKDVSDFFRTEKRSGGKSAE